MPRDDGVPPGTLVMLVLRVLSREPLHGYAIAQRIHTLSLRGISHKRNTEPALACDDCTETDFNRKDGAIFAAAHQFEAHTYRPYLGLIKLAFVLLSVLPTLGFRHQDLQVLFQEFVARVAEYPLGTGVDDHKISVFVHCEDRLSCGIQQSLDGGASLLCRHLRALAASDV